MSPDAPTLPATTRPAFTDRGGCRLRFGQRGGGVFVGLAGEHTGKHACCRVCAINTAIVEDLSIPGIGATRHDWDASHGQSPAFNNGAVYGYDPSLPDYLSANHSVYWGATENSDMGTTVPVPVTGASGGSGGLAGGFTTTVCPLGTPVTGGPPAHAGAGRLAAARHCPRCRRRRC